MKPSSTQQLRNLLHREGACHQRRKPYEGLSPALAFQRILRSPRDLAWLASRLRNQVRDPYIDGWAVRFSDHPNHKVQRAAAIAILRAYAKRRGWKL